MPRSEDVNNSTRPSDHATNERPGEATAQGARPGHGEASRQTESPPKAAQTHGPGSHDEDNDKADTSRAAPLYKAELQALVQRANRGDKAALADLRSMLDRHPEVWRTCGDLSRLAEQTWIDLLAGQEALGDESIKRHVQGLKADLLGPHPTAIERLLVDSIGICYLAARHSEISAADSGNHSLGQAALCIKRCESGQRRLLSAIRSLALLRASAPEGLAPLDSLRLYKEQGEKRKQA